MCSRVDVEVYACDDVRETFVRDFVALGADTDAHAVRGMGLRRDDPQRQQAVQPQPVAKHA